jgi:hypothetical protein
MAIDLTNNIYRHLVKKITAIFVFVLEAWKLELNRKSKRKVLNNIELATITIGSVGTPQVPEGYIIFRVYFIVILLMQIVYYFKNVMLSSVNTLI